MRDAFALDCCDNRFQLDFNKVVTLECVFSMGEWRQTFRDF